MSEEMRAKKLAEEKAAKEEEEAIQADLRDAKDDICPHCLQPVSSYPYINFHPVLGWLECASCGIVFSPKSIRNVKVRKASRKVEVPKLLVPR